MALLLMVLCPLLLLLLLPVLCPLLCLLPCCTPFLFGLRCLLLLLCWGLPVLSHVVTYLLLSLLPASLRLSLSLVVLRCPLLLYPLLLPMLRRLRLLPLLLCHPRRLHCSAPTPDPIEVRTTYACTLVVVMLA